MNISDFDELKNVITEMRKVCALKEYDFEITYWGTGGWSTHFNVTKDGWQEIGKTKASRTTNGVKIKITLADSEKPKSIEEDDMNYSPDGGATPMNNMIINLMNSTRLARDWDGDDQKKLPPSKETD